MKIRTWHVENLVVVSALAGMAAWSRLPFTLATLGWALAIWAAHSARSHSVRKAEQKGEPQDWLTHVFTWLGGAGLLLALEAPARFLAAPSLIIQVAFTLHRAFYRAKVKPLSVSWSRGDD
jgi:hypothetical protein